MASASRVATIGALILALYAPTTYAQTEDGVTVDPDSPAGKEYALPIDQARRDATDGEDARRGGKAPAGAPPPAFGEGVRPETERAPGPASSTGVSKDADGKRVGMSADGTPSTTTAAERAQERKGIDRALLKASDGDGGASDGSLALLLGGVVVMVLGVAAGLLLRRGKA